MSERARGDQRGDFLGTQTPYHGATQKKNDNRFKIVNAMGKEKLSLKTKIKMHKNQRDLWLCFCRWKLKEKAWQQQKMKKKTRRRKKGKKILQEVINYMVKEEEKITREWKKNEPFQKEDLKSRRRSWKIERKNKNKNKTSIIRKLISIFVVVVCLCVNGHCVCLFMLVFMSGKHHESKVSDRERERETDSNNKEICLYGRRVPKSVRGKFTHYVDFLKNEIYLYTQLFFDFFQEVNTKIWIKIERQFIYIFLCVYQSNLSFWMKVCVLVCKVKRYN